MKTFIALACLLLTAGNLLAQNYYRAIQQAKRDSAQNDAEQRRIANATGGAPAAAAPGAAAPAPATVDPALQATLRNIAGLQTDLASFIAAADKPDATQKTSLMNNLTEAAQGTKASADTVKKVAEDLSAALPGKKKLAAAQQTKLAREIHALFNSSHLTAAQQQMLLTDIQKTLTDGGVPLDAAVDTVTDLKQVITETK